MVVVRQEDITLKSDEALLQAHKHWFPIRHDFQIGDDLEEVLVRPRVVVTPQGSGGVFDLRLIVVDAGDEDDGDDMVRVHLPPLVEERGQEGVHDLLIIALAIARDARRL